MKKLSLIGLFLTLLTHIVIAQVPQTINYQAVARDNAGLEIINTSITVRFSIGAAGVNSSTFDYQETHTTSTNAFGLFNIRIGQGTPNGPTFNSINWNSQRFLLVEVNFGSGFEQMGAAQPFVSVPYAVLAQNVLTKELPATANNNDILSWNGTAWVATAPGSVSETTTTLVDNGNGTFTYTNEIGAVVTFNANIPDADSNPTNEIQDLQLVGNILTITNNGSATPIDLSIYRELPASAVNGQVLTWNGTAWIAQNPGSGADNWGSQTVVTNSTLTGDGTAGNPLSGFDGQYSSLSGAPTIPTQTSQLTNNSGFITSPNDADSDPTNEIQNITISGNTLNISGGTGTTIATNAPATNQVLTWNGTAWIAQNPGSGADNWGSQTVVTNSTLTGDGTAGNPLSGFDGQYSSLSGAPTIPTQTSQLTNNSGFITSPNDADSDPTNEIQNVTISGNTLNISGGTGTTIATNAPTTNQVLTWNGTAWIAQNPGSGADNWGSQTVVTNSTLTGNGTAGNPLIVAQPLPTSASTGQTITWNGTAWVASNVALVPTYAAGTGVSITGTSPNFTINNTAPDQTVAITGTGATSVSGTYPNFTVSSTDNDNQTLTKTGNALSISGGNSINISNTAPIANQVLTWNGTNWIAATPASAPTYTAGTGININGSNVISNTAPDQTVVMNAGTGISITGTYPNFTVTNSLPNQVLTLTGAGGTTVSGTYPNLTITSTDAQTLTIGGNVISISNGNSITIPSLPNGTSDQTLRHDGTAWVANSAMVNNGADIGIGTTAPQARLHVNQLINGAGAQQMISNTSNSTNSSSALAFTNNVPAQGYIMGIDNTSGTFKISNSSANINANNRIQIDPTGNVGIGNFVGVTSKLDVDGQITMRTGATAGYVPVSNAAGTMTWTDPSTLFTAGPWTKTGLSLYPTNTSDNVGIGTASPATKLHIEQNNTPVILIRESTPTGGALILLESQRQFLLHSNESGTFKITDNTAGMERIIVDGASGNVGIGIPNSPNSRLDVVSSSFNVLSLRTTGANSNVNIDIVTTGVGAAQFGISGGTGGYRFLTPGNGITPVFAIENNGRASVNLNTSALSALDVNGQITMRTGATAGYVPVSNAAGTMTWTDPSTLFTAGPWTKTGSAIHPTVNTDYVGIGTNSPTTALSMVGSSNSTLINANSESPTSAIRVYNGDLTNNNFSSLAFATQLSNGGNSEMAKVVGVNVNHTIGSQQGDLAFLTRNSSNLNEVMRITGTGNVGIGTTNPINRLTVQGTGAAASIPSTTSSGVFRIAVSGNEGMDFGKSAASPYAMWMQVGYNGTAEPLTIQPLGGNVGIGVASPTYRFHVENNNTRRTGYFINSLSANNIAGDEIMGVYSIANGSGGSDKVGGYFESANGTGINYGVRGLAFNGSVAMGVYGSASGGSANNWAGYFESGNVHVQNNLAVGTTSTSFLVNAETSTLLRTGYFVNSTNSASSTIGVYGQAAGTGTGSKRGGSFEAYNGTGENVGVRGLAQNSTGTNYGVYGITLGSGAVANYGVYGTATGATTNWAGYFASGNVYVQNNVGIGTTTPGTKVEINGAVTFTPTTRSYTTGGVLNIGNEGYIRISSTGNASISSALGSGSAIGQTVIIENANGTFTLNMQVGGNLRLNGNVNYVMGPGDTLSLIWNGSQWLEIGRSNN